MIWAGLILAATMFVAYANGANDNFKGVATLFGAGTASYRLALWWASITTLAGSICAYFLARGLIETFSGKGLLPESYLGDPAFLAAVIMGAGVTVLIAARLGLPISTTHALTGALVGAGLMAVGSGLGFATLGKGFVVPLLVSPVLALVLTLVLYPTIRWVRTRLGIRRETCLCVGLPLSRGPLLHRGDTPVGDVSSAAVVTAALPAIDAVVSDSADCERRDRTTYAGRLVRVEAQKVRDGLHFLSAGAVSFARGLNDTPKIVALAAAFGGLALDRLILVVALVMAVGGFVSARRVAETMSRRITRLNQGQGLTANFVTALLVIFASHLGVPVSTTHVSCGALFGIGAANRRARWATVGGIASAWIMTLPIAAAAAALGFWALRS